MQRRGLAGSENNNNNMIPVMAEEGSFDDIHPLPGRGGSLTTEYVKEVSPHHANNDGAKVSSVADRAIA
jgi:hypothetical protein